MSQTTRHLKNIYEIFTKSVKSVQPSSLFCGNLILDNHNHNKKGELASIINASVSQTAQTQNCHIVGFGKAVLGMAVQLERILANRLKSGILSIPLGTVRRFAEIPDMMLSPDTVLQIFECAECNLPDHKAVMAANQIKSLAESMTNDDILFVLISGGGSALLPLPKPPITLETKLQLIQMMASRGADINEINTVRIAISETKGGKLAQSAKNAKQIISLIISDVINDPLDIIASGPTVPFNLNGRKSAKDILLFYKIWENLDKEIQTVIENQLDNQLLDFKNNTIHVIGSNKIAVKTCAEEAQKLKYVPFILSTTIQGNLQQLSDTYENFLQNLRTFQKGTLEESEFYAVFPFDKNIFENFIFTVKECGYDKSLLLILGGEPTVVLTGNGLGGRNQELALRMSLKLSDNESLNDICFLSAGTDGIDGPTLAAGALGCCAVIEDYLKTNTRNKLMQYITENNSYEFYNQLENGKYHLITGHTGTNVMDIHLILLP